MTDTVLRLLRDRKKQGSTPGHRSDDARLVLLVEGGSSRGVYSYGMAIAIEQLGLLPMFDAVYGSSAGALNAAWLLCGRAESSVHAWWDPIIMGTTINPRRALRRLPVVDTRFLVHTVYTEIMPMGFQEILDSTVEFHPIATDALTGQATDLHEQIRDRSSLQAALRASTAMPLLAGEPIEIDGRSFVDAGVSESVPVRTALAQKATHIVALRTRRMDETTSAPSLGERLMMSRWFARRAPGALEPWLRREAIRAEEERLLASHPATLQIRPPIGSAPIGRTERRPLPLRAAVGTGRQAALNELAGCVEELP
ncbi:Predicted phospholipase, patatin/cPLA2 family [Streptosporangium subroseum]|uniref:Predicted phospholipase, patatin/cPLA2 family n=1 Tax=Streptosporangium subroseum TaxID=106412 RepID=A0A239D463_9ACTN|nr:patatin-like phospholipase family protein [Streptosporangium subroseum]SNS27195.1 Predicted phospholipase, patatin/cPLA2 family [Streptosporangium subroseum]